MRERRGPSSGAVDFDLVILDWNLPVGEGPDLLRDFRTEGEDAPVTLLTARAKAADRVLGLYGGAVDYIVKPFELTEELLTTVWGGSGDLTTPTIDTHVLQLRRKTAAECFETLRGVGYRYRRGAP